MTAQSLDELRRAWRAGVDELAIGQRLFEAVPRNERPEWAGRLLAHALSTTSPCSELDAVLQAANTPALWPDAAEAFHSVRQLSLAEGRSGRLDPVRQAVLDLAELTAKVTYNATGSSAPFDAHAAWRIAPAIRRLAELAADPEFESEAWDRLVWHTGVVA